MSYGCVNRILKRQDKDTVSCGKHFASFNTDVISSIATYFSKRVFGVLGPCESNLVFIASAALQPPQNYFALR